MNRQVVLVIMDGVGLSDKKEGNAFKNANTPNLDNLLNNYPNIAIHAHGTYVGLPSDDDMGNSEVGHNAMGCGQIYAQGAKLVNDSIESGRLFEGSTWKDAINYCKNNKLHFIGLLSDGGVHSHINHLFKMMEQAKKDGIKDVCIHALLDGRDVPAKSADKYINMLEDKINELNDENFNSRIVSGGGRMNITMDRYEANWSMVEKGWHTHVLGEGRSFPSAIEAINTYRSEDSEVIDQYLEPFVISNTNGTIEDNDSVIFFNFRGDRAIEISRAFDEEGFNKFDRVRVPKVYYAGMLQYDSELNIPKNFLTSPPDIKNTLTEELIKNNINEYAISETQKYGHVTYFWNGNRIDKFDEQLETYDIVESDNIPFDQEPAMKSYEITDKFIEAIKSNKYQFLRINYPNGDMVGHTGNYDATVKAMEAVDENIGKIIKACDETNSILVITADHGNAEDMLNDDNSTKTSHSLNPVPFIIYNDNDIEIVPGDYGLANIASTICLLLNVKPNDKWEKPIIKIK